MDSASSQGQTTLRRIAAIALIWRWSRQAGWGRPHVLALAGGALLTYAWHAFPQQPSAGSTGQIDLIGNAIFALGAVLLLAAAWRGIGVHLRGESSRAVEQSSQSRDPNSDSRCLLSPYPLSPYNAPVIRVAAVADIHAGPESVGVLGPLFAGLKDEADILLVPGDVTRDGDPVDAEILVAELKDVGVPVVAVLGNHDYEGNQAEAVTAILRAAGIHVLNRSGIVLDIAGQRVAIAGTKGFGGGFDDALAEDVGEPEMKSWIRHAEIEAEALEDVLNALVGDIRIVLLHYAPVTDTLAGERLELYPFSGNSMLGAAIDRAGADLVLHGHVHRGSPAGVTPGGIPVRNVAQPVIRKPYVVFTIDEEDEEASPPRRWLRRQLEHDEAAESPRGRVREGRRPRWMRRAAGLAHLDKDAPVASDDQ
jgi:Icc-related predicted phosphoesterase